MVTSTFDAIFTGQQAPRWPGTLSGLVRHHTGVLVPESQNLADGDDWATFDSFVPNPVAEAIYQAPEVDVGFDDTVRVFADLQSALGPGETSGLADPAFEIDHRLDGAAYDGFEPWSLGNVTARFVTSRIVLDTAKGVAKVTGFAPTVDLKERGEAAGSVPIAPGGTLIAFARRFHLTPMVAVSADGGSASIATKAAVTTTGFNSTGLFWRASL